MEDTYFLDDDFMLHSKAAKNLYHQYAKTLPIIDYHNHLPAQEIASNKKFENLTEIWLKGDHYKWRAMRTLGINERLISGNASDTEKFSAWANSVPNTVRNPLFHWTHMELKNPFGIERYLNKNSAADIYQSCNQQLQEDRFSTQGLLQRFDVDWICTTDDPCDDLVPHTALGKSNFKSKVYPGFRPDKVFNIQDKKTFLKYLDKLEISSGIKINNLETLLLALEHRVDYFHQNGCRISDHGLVQMPELSKNYPQIERDFTDFIQNNSIKHFENPTAFVGIVLLALCKMYHQRNWTQQFHLGPLRNNNTRYYNQIGPDTGFDSIGDHQQAVHLSAFLNALDKSDQLAKTILYNVNPAFNEVFATMAGNFNDGTIKGKIQWGSAWWFADQQEGISNQLNILSNMGVLSTFIGMLTDSRSFLSFPRHEYFRRILCDLFGAEMEKGWLPNDEIWMGSIIRDIAYYNAKEYFNL
ncbi:MAG: glucuronate isomerase [Flammeovirgaceae bacterium]|nr:glucuronate isomerase [Flammeovirgaceae bacterium]